MKYASTTPHCRRALLPAALLLAAALGGCEIFRAATWSNPADRPVGSVELAGQSAPADSVVYVVDFSAADTSAHRYMLAAVVRSMRSLTPGQSFGLVAFGGGEPAIYAPEGSWQLLPATQANIGAACQFLLAHVEHGPPDEGSLRRAVVAALRFEPHPPNVVFLLARRPWAEPDLTARIAQANGLPGGRVKSAIWTIGFVNPEVQPLLERIAGENSGQFRMVEAVDLGR
jgi:hypothetical protein